LVLAFVGGACENFGVTAGVTPRQSDLFRSSASVVEGKVDAGSVWAFLHVEGRRLFPDEMFSDLFSVRGRRSVPPQVVATVMVLQRLFGKSDREAVEAFEFDVRWKYACGVDLDFPGFAHTVLVDMRARLASSNRPRRIFEVTVDAAKSAGLVGHRRVLDSTPLYDAVATMDTITLVRSSIRSLLASADPTLETELRAVMTSGDEYVSNSKPLIDWDDRTAREQLIDSRARDGHACLLLLDDRALTPEVAEAATLLASVLGQDIAESDDGAFRIMRKVAKDRIISTVDPDARHGHKTAARGFDGFKGHIAEDPDSEMITNTAVTAGNAGDASVAEELIVDLVDDPTRGDVGEVFGDAAYGTGEFQQKLTDDNLQSGCKTQPVAQPAGGMFSKEQFIINLETGTVTCPNKTVVTIRRHADGSGTAAFRRACQRCPIAASCTTSRNGRTITININETALIAARARSRDPQWRARYRATRPKVERKLAHLMRRRHGGRNARVRGHAKVAADFNLLAAAINIARAATLQLVSTPTGWATR
jgi:Transposase DDE domain/Transposase domain (DUF772)